jgi:hypothetical protein
VGRQVVGDFVRDVRLAHGEATRTLGGRDGDDRTARFVVPAMQCPPLADRDWGDAVDQQRARTHDTRHAAPSTPPVTSQTEYSLSAVSSGVGEEAETGADLGVRTGSNRWARTHFARSLRGTRSNADSRKLAQVSR